MTSHALAPSASSFTLLAEKGNFVDKTRALVEFLDDNQPVHLLLRPRRSGKTTLLRLFRAFFERTNFTDQEHRRQLFVQNELAITNDPRFETEFAQYPVLYVDFSNVIGETMDELLDTFKCQISAAVRNLERAGCFSNFEELDGGDRTFLDEVTKGPLAAVDWADVLFRLTEIVHILTKNRVIVLVDEYDTPTSDAVRHGYFPAANAFFRRVFPPLLKNNEFIRGALVVGILSVAKAGWLSGMNNFRVYPLSSSKYSTACMFTEDETRALYHREASLRGVEKALPFSLEDLQGWYNGYYTFDGARLYSPWSVANALTDGHLRSYWTESGYDQLIQERIYHMLDTSARFRKQMDFFLANDDGEVEIEEGMSYLSVADMTLTQLWTFIYYAGYLTEKPPGSLAASVDHDTASSDDVDSSSENDSTDGNAADAKKILASIPNFEIRRMFRQLLRNHVSRHMGTKTKARSVTLFLRMVSGRMASFADKFGKLIWEGMPTEFLGGKKFVYQAYVCAFFTAASEAANDLRYNAAWEVQVGGIGCLDLILQRMRDTTGVIQEHKRVRLTKKDKKEGYGKSQSERLTNMAEKAMEQLKIKQYRASMRPHVTKIHEYGLAFLGPYCAILGRSLERKPGEQWVIVDSYDADEDEKRRDRLYRSQSS